MSKVRVAVIGSVGKSVLLDTSAGPRALQEIADLKAQISVGLGGTIQHRNLQGLQVGDDHPQYTGNQFPETITGQWNFQTIPDIQGETLAEFVEDVVGDGLVQNTASISWTYGDTAATLEADVNTSWSPFWQADHRWADYAKVEFGDGGDLQVFSDGITAVIRTPYGNPLNLDLSAALELNGDPGTSTYVLTSNGPGLSPTWEASGGGGGGGGTGYPGTLDDLIFWFQADTLMLSSGKIVPVLQNRSSTFLSMSANYQGTGATRGATQLNSHNVLTVPGTSAGRYQTSIGFPLSKATVFVVFKPASLAADGAFVAGPSGSFQVQINATTGKIRLVKTFVALIATATTGMSAGTWYQANATYDDATGAFAFRQGQAANGSGTNVVTITATSNSFFYDPPANASDANGDIAELIVFNRVLSSTEIANVESYLNTKWGV